MNKYTQSWFRLIKHWLDRKRYGLTLPFLVGATAFKYNEYSKYTDDSSHIIEEIIEYPFDGYIVHIRWCPDYNSEVFAVYEVNSPYRLKKSCQEYYPKDKEVPSLIIDNEVVAQLKLKKDKNEIISCIINRANKHLKLGNYSRVWTDDGLMYGPLVEEEKIFIQEALA